MDIYKCSGGGFVLAVERDGQLIGHSREGARDPGYQYSYARSPEALVRIGVKRHTTLLAAQRALRRIEAQSLAAICMWVGEWVVASRSLDAVSGDSGDACEGYCRAQAPPCGPCARYHEDVDVIQEWVAEAALCLGRTLAGRCLNCGRSTRWPWSSWRCGCEEG